MRRYLVDVDLANNELLNVRLQPVTDADTPVNRKIAYHTDRNELVVGNGSSWVSGVGGGDMAIDYDVETDAVGSDTLYVGYALPGTAKSSPGWKIKKVVDSGGDISIRWANGTTTLSCIWDNRLSLTYIA